MKPAITVDLRGYDFETGAELTEIVRELIPAIREDYPMVYICGLVISERQLKRIRLERYMQGVPAERVKQEVLTSIDGWPVTVLGEDEVIGEGLHEIDEP